MSDELSRSRSLRFSAAKAKKRAAVVPGASSFSTPSVKYSDLTFKIDSETERFIEEERSKVRDTLDAKE